MQVRTKLRDDALEAIRLYQAIDNPELPKEKTYSSKLSLGFISNVVSRTVDKKNDTGRKRAKDYRKDIQFMSEEELQKKLHKDVQDNGILSGSTKLRSRLMNVLRVYLDISPEEVRAKEENMMKNYVRGGIHASGYTMMPDRNTVHIEAQLSLINARMKTILPTLEENRTFDSTATNGL